MSYNASNYVPIVKAVEVHAIDEITGLNRVTVTIDPKQTTFTMQSKGIDVAAVEIGTAIIQALMFAATGAHKEFLGKSQINNEQET